MNIPMPQTPEEVAELLGEERTINDTWPFCPTCGLECSIRYVANGPDDVDPVAYCVNCGDLT